MINPSTPQLISCWAVSSSPIDQLNTSPWRRWSSDTSWALNSRRCTTTPSTTTAEGRKRRRNSSNRFPAERISRTPDRGRTRPNTHHDLLDNVSGPRSPDSATNCITSPGSRRDTPLQSTHSPTLESLHLSTWWSVGTRVPAGTRNHRSHNRAVNQTRLAWRTTSWRRWRCTSSSMASASPPKAATPSWLLPARWAISSTIALPASSTQWPSIRSRTERAHRGRYRPR